MAINKKRRVLQGVDLKTRHFKNVRCDACISWRSAFDPKRTLLWL